MDLHSNMTMSTTSTMISPVTKTAKTSKWLRLYSYINRKVWCHQIGIQNNLGFIVSDLTYIL